MKNCLACLLPLDNIGTDYHEQCLKDFWQTDTPVLQLDYSITELENLAQQNITQRVIVPGVQPKLSLGFKYEQEVERLTIVGALDGRYILKPPYGQFPQMPEVESLSMLMAQRCGIPTVPFLLVPLQGGELAYLTRRIDRDQKANKYAMEDACQFTERLTEHKYRGSYEQIAKAILKYNGNRLIDVVRFYEQVIVSYFIGNNDMHLKNFSLISRKESHYQLAPAYDILAVQLLLPEDTEDLALTLNGKRNKLKKNDFNIAMAKAKIPEKAIENLWNRIIKGTKDWGFLIDQSSIDKESKKYFKALIKMKKTKLKVD